jgi:DNA-binding MarR family transcriptional regulator
VLTVVLQHGLTHGAHTQAAAAAAFGDRRAVLNRLTPSGRERFTAKQAEIEERWRDALGDISADELGQAARVLRRMAEVLDAI